MKNRIVASIVGVLVVSLTMAQQIQYDINFEPNENHGEINYWRTFEGPNPVVQIIDNPDTDNGTVPVTKVLELIVDQNSACYAGVENIHSTLGTWTLDASVSSNLSLSLDINSSIPEGRIGIKMVNQTNGTVFEITDDQGDYYVADEWQTLTWDISNGAISGENNNIDQIIVFADWRCSGVPTPRTEDVTLLIDNISWGANQITGFPEPSCSNGIQDGDESGVDCGGSCTEDCIPDPPFSAPQYGSIGSDLYVYSDIVGPSVENFLFNSFGGNGVYTEIDIQSDGNMTGKLFNLDYFGSQWNPADASPYNYVHLDYFATTATDFKFFLIDDSLSQTVCCGNPAEPFYSFGPGGDEPIINGQWTSVFIPLTHFSNFNSGWDGTDLKQTKFTGNGIVYFDNIYFSTENILGLEEFSNLVYNVYPNPTDSIWIFSSKTNEITKIELYDIGGKLIKSVTSNSNEVKLNAVSFNPGIYLAKVYSKSDFEIKQLIKK